MRCVVLMPVYRAATFFNTVASELYRLDPQPEIYVFAENNSPDRTLELVSHFKRKKEIIRLWFRNDAMKYCQTRYDLIGIVRQTLLQRARQLDPDYAIFLDADIRVMSRDFIEELTSWPEADIVGGKYLREYPQGRMLACLFKSGDPEKQFQLRVYPKTTDQLEEIAAMSGGCLRLSRKVLQDRRINFYPVKRDWAGDVSEDYGYCLEAGLHGYRCWLDNVVELQHWVTQHHIDGKAWKVNELNEPIPFCYGV